MEKRDLFDQVALVEQQIGALYQELGNIKKQIKHLLEKNQQLTIENQHLRERIQEHNKEQEQEKEQKETLSLSKPEQKKRARLLVGEGYDNLARLYYEGFHICNQDYGGLRTEGDCLFCLTFLNKQG